MKKLVKPKMFIGGILNAGLSIFNTITAAQKEKSLIEGQRNAELQEAERLRVYNEVLTQKDEAQNLKEFGKSGFVDAPSYYAYGGKTKSGLADSYVKPLANGISVVKGATHEQGGVDMGDVEMEGEEVLVGDKVFSNRIPYNNTTVAKHAQMLGKKKGTFDSIIKENRKDRFATSDAMRENEKLEKEINDLFNYQEKFKEAMGLVNPGTAGQPKMGWGGVQRWNVLTKKYEYVDESTGEVIPENELKALRNEEPLAKMSLISTTKVPTTTDVKTEIPLKSTTGSAISPEKKGFNFSKAGNAVANVAGFVAPFVDNIVNANLINKLPEIPKPVLQKNIKLDRVSPDQRLLEIDKSARDARNFTARNTASSNVANQLSNNIQGTSITAKNAVMGDVDEKNAMLDFREKWLNKDIDASNVQTLNNTSLMKMQRDWEKNRMQGDNWINAIEDFKLQQNESGQKKLDELKIRLTAEMDSSGAGDRSMKSVYDKLVAEGNTELANLLLQTFPNLKK